MISRSLFTYLRLTTLGGLFLAAALAAPVPVKLLFGPEFLQRVTLSPDGTQLAAVASWDAESRGLLLIDAKTGKNRALSGSSVLDVGSVWWQGSEQLFFTVLKNRRYSEALYSTKTSALGDYVPICLYDVVNIIGQPAARPDRLLLWQRLTSSVGDPKPLREIELSGTAKLRSVSLESRIRREFPVPPDTVLGYESTPLGEPGLVYTQKDGKISYRYWDETKTSWLPSARPLAEATPVELDIEPGYVWVATRRAADGVVGLQRMNLRTGDLETVKEADPRYDLDEANLLYSVKQKKLIGLRYQRARLQQLYWAAPFDAVQKAVEGSLPAEDDHRIIDWDDDETIFLIESRGPRQPGAYHLYRLAEGSLSQIGARRPELTREQLRPTRTVRTQARDGIEIDSYLTLPSGASKASPVPLVVLAHGGPWYRDSWAFNSEVQFLASRGYAVLQPNYRGSTGYQWPGPHDEPSTDFNGMRDDVIDATRAALKTGLFDPQRVGIMGSSFGGYLAVACPVEEPTLFRCGISFAGVFDWAALVKDRGAEGARAATRYEREKFLLGDPKKEKERFEAISPLARLERLKVPLFLAHGVEDKVASIDQTRRLARELRARDIPHETYYRRFVGHGFYDVKDSFAYYQKLEPFLARHLGTAPPAAAPVAP